MKKISLLLSVILLPCLEASAWKSLCIFVLSILTNTHALLEGIFFESFC